MLLTVRRSYSSVGCSRVVLAVTTLCLSMGIFIFGPSGEAASALSIKVQGNDLVNQNGQVVRLLGVDRSGAEYECVKNHKVFDGPSDAASVKAMVSWHINAVRVPLNEDCWLGINGAVTGGAVYREQVEQ